MSRTPAFYADPALYERVHADGTDDEVWLLDHLAREHGNGGKAALEPACGSGRYLAGLLRRGWSVDGYDSSAAMVAYAQRRLGRRAAISRGDMRTFRTKRRFDLAFNLLSTFRHLMTDRDALAHLRVTAGCLNPGGIFVLGLDLADYGHEEPDEEVWNEKGGIRHVMMTLPAGRRERREKIINFVKVPGRKMIESSYDLRSYDAPQLKALLSRSPLRVEACYALDGKPAELGGSERALWLVLKNRR